MGGKSQGGMGGMPPTQFGGQQAGSLTEPNAIPGGQMRTQGPSSFSQMAESPYASANRAANPYATPVTRNDPRFGGNSNLFQRGGQFSPWGGGGGYRTGGNPNPYQPQIGQVYRGTPAMGSNAGSTMALPTMSAGPWGMAQDYGSEQPAQQGGQRGMTQLPMPPQGEPQQRLMDNNRAGWNTMGGYQQASPNSNSQMMGRLMQMLGGGGMYGQPQVGGNMYNQMQGQSWQQGRPQGGMQGQTSLYGRRY